MDVVTSAGEPVTAATTLSLRGIRRSFGDTRALDGMDLDLVAGQVTALVGHNGAGKSTLLRILSGADRPDSGEVLLDGEPVTFRQPSDALARGVSAVYQELSGVPHLSVAQNMFLGQERSRAQWLDKQAMARRARELCAEFGLDVDVRTPLGRLTVAQRQLVEVATAVNRNARFLLLDEPTTSLEARQVDRLLATVRRLAAERAVAVLLIDHKLDEVFACAQHIVGMANGRTVLSGAAGELTRQDVIQSIVGHPTADHEHPTTEPTGGPRGATVTERPAVFVAEGVTTARLSDVRLTVGAGEVVGIYGLMGSGRTSFLRTVAGDHRLTGGRMTLEGQDFAPTSIRGALRRGVAYVSEERKTEGLLPNLGIYYNVGITVLDEHSRAGVVRRGRLVTAAKEQLASMRTHGDLSKGITALSGGNQQKAMLARAFLQRPRLLLLDEPTKGVDIGAKVEIYALIRDLATATGAGVLVVTSEEEEVLALTDTVNVFHDGTTVVTGVPTRGLSVSRLKSMAWLGADSESEPGEAPE